MRNKNSKSSESQKGRIVAPIEQRLTMKGLHGGMGVNKRFAMGISQNLQLEKEHNVTKLDEYLNLKNKGLLYADINYDSSGHDSLITKRNHSIAAIRLIQNITRKNSKDEFGLPSAFFNKASTNTFCCEKHASLVQAAFLGYLQSLSFEVRSWMREEIDDADLLKNGYVSNQTLTRILHEVLFEYGVEPSQEIATKIFHECADVNDENFLDCNEFVRLVDSLILSEESKRLNCLKQEKIKMGPPSATHI